MIFTFCLRKYIKISILVILNPYFQHENMKLTGKWQIKLQGQILFTFQKYNYFFNGQIINAKTGFIKNGPNFYCDNNFWFIAIKIQTIFNRTSSGIYILAIENLITFLESRKDLPLQLNLPFSYQFHVFMLKIWMQITNFEIFMDFCRRNIKIIKLVILHPYFQHENLKLIRKWQINL